MSWDAITAISTGALAIIAFAALIYAKKQLDAFHQENQISHLIDLVNQFSAEPIVTLRKQLASARLDGSFHLTIKNLDPQKPPYQLHEILNFFEHMGYLLDGNYITLEGVSTEFHYWIFRLWDDAKPLIDLDRRENPVYYKHLTKMVDRLRGSEGAKSIPDAELVYFYREEAQISPGRPIMRRPRPVS
jgi:hypothetical protein